MNETKQSIHHVDGIEFRPYTSKEISEFPDSELGTVVFDAEQNYLMQCTDDTPGSNVWTPFGVDIDTTDFCELGDAPGSYEGFGKRSVAVRADEAGLEFVNRMPGEMQDGIVSVDGLRYKQYTTLEISMLPTPDYGTVVFNSDDQMLYVYIESSTDVWESVGFFDSEEAKRFSELNDVPDGFEGHAGKVVFINDDETGLMFGSPGVLMGKGPKGENGPTGPAGVNGTTGPDGKQGPTGINGTTGPHGPDGKQGPTGNDGTTGPQGPDGKQGPTGNDGTFGPDGKQGPTGGKGTTGPIGHTGPMGHAGPHGSDGKQGPTGPDGKQGPTGGNGITGPKGQTGADGKNGITGTQGPVGKGTTGPHGPAGQTGERGPTGQQGTQGPEGKGTTGPLGQRGATGPMGPMGSPGEYVTMDEFTRMTNMLSGLSYNGTWVPNAISYPDEKLVPNDNGKFWICNATGNGKEGVRWDDGNWIIFNGSGDASLTGSWDTYNPQFKF